MKRGLLFLLFLCSSILLFAQDPIRFGDREVYLEANVRLGRRGVRSSSSLELGVPIGDKLNVLVQFERGVVPYAQLANKDILLGDYLGSNAYYAQVAPGSRPSDFEGTGLRAITPIRAEWKVANSLLLQQYPTWAVSGDELQVTLSWFVSVSWEKVRALLDARGIRYHSFLK